MQTSWNPQTPKGSTCLKRDFRVPQSNPKETSKVTFWRPPKVTSESLSGSKSRFCGHFVGETRKWPCSHFWVHFIFVGGGGGGGVGVFEEVNMSTNLRSKNDYLSLLLPHLTTESVWESVSWTTSEGREWGVGSVVVEFAVFGAPWFSVQRSQNTYFKGFWDLWTENGGTPPKKPNPTTTDPTPRISPLVTWCFTADKKHNYPSPALNACRLRT